MRARLVERYFEFEARRLAAAEGGAEASTVKCPICLRPFTRRHLLAGDLTLEHAMSRRVGGRTLTITCRPCNNTHGSRLDKHVVEAAKARDAFAGHGALRTTVRVGDAVFEAEVAWKPDPIDTNVITVIGAASDPKQLEAAKGYLQTGTRDLQLSSPLGYVQDRLWLGLLRAAYLCIFRHLGYRYALAPSVTPIRRQISGEDAPSPYLAQVVTELDTPPLPPSYDFLPVDLERKTGHPVYLVFLQTRIVQPTTHAVLLPHAGPAQEDLFARLAAVAETLKGSSITVPLNDERL